MWAFEPAISLDKVQDPIRLTAADPCIRQTYIFLQHSEDGAILRVAIRFNIFR